MLTWVAGGLDPGDPVHSLLDTSTFLTGLCIDADPEILERARDALKHHGVRVVEAFLDPDLLTSILLETFKTRHTIDVLKVDVDGFDVSLLDAALAVLDANVVVAEFNWVIPPPFRYAQHYLHSADLSMVGAKGTRESLFGASLSYLVEFFGIRGFFLYKIGSADTVWIHRRVAQIFENYEEGLNFPVDEWACYLQTPRVMASDETKEIASAEYLPTTYSVAHTLDWLLEPDLWVSLRRLWGNLTEWNQAPFSLDMAGRNLPH